MLKWRWTNCFPPTLVVTATVTLMELLCRSVWTSWTTTPRRTRGGLHLSPRVSTPTNVLARSALRRASGSFIKACQSIVLYSETITIKSVFLKGCNVPCSRFWKGLRTDTEGRLEQILLVLAEAKALALVGYLNILFLKGNCGVDSVCHLLAPN